MTAGTVQDPCAMVTDPEAPVTAYPLQLVLFTLASTRIIGEPRGVRACVALGMRTSVPRKNSDIASLIEGCKRRISPPGLFRFFKAQEVTFLETGP